MKIFGVLLLIFFNLNNIFAEEIKEIKTKDDNKQNEEIINKAKDDINKAKSDIKKYIKDENLDLKKENPKKIYIIRNKYYNNERKNVGNENESQEKKSKEAILEQLIIQKVQETKINPPKKIEIMPILEGKTFFKDEILKVKSQENLKKIPLNKNFEKKNFFEILPFHKMKNIYIDGNFGFNLGNSNFKSSFFESNNSLIGFHTKNFDSSINYIQTLNYSTAIGVSFSSYLRAEIEGFGYDILKKDISLSNIRTLNSTVIFEKSIDTGAIKNIFGATGNILIDTNRRSRLFFSFGSGIGFGYISFADSNINSEITMIYNGIAQLNFRALDNLIIYIKYKYTFFQGRDFKLNNPMKSIQIMELTDNRKLIDNTMEMKNFGINTISFGMRFYFL